MRISWYVTLHYDHAVCHLAMTKGYALCGSSQKAARRDHFLS